VGIRHQETIWNEPEAHHALAGTWNRRRRLTEQKLFHANPQRQTCPSTKEKARPVGLLSLLDCAAACSKSRH
jgi:hypothetical protein